MTDFTTQDLPRPEYPRPLLRREQWLNLNGVWAFKPDLADLGQAGSWYVPAQWPDEGSTEITVPYAPGSQASGVDWAEPANVVWYRRLFDRPDWSAQDVLLNIGACDYTTDVYLNGHHVCRHQGGYSPVQCAIGRFLQETDNVLVVRAADTDSWQQPRGKQAGDTRWPIDYDAVIGIWQSVWLEPTQRNYGRSIFSRYEAGSRELKVTLTLAEQCQGSLEVEAFLDGTSVMLGRSAFANRNESTVTLGVEAPQLWSPNNPILYDLSIKVLSESGELMDQIASYTGLREVRCEGGAILLNGEPQYLKGVLDQGYFPGGWYTAQDDAALRRDVELTKAMGFNFVRKHQKIEDPRYLYWADRLGLMLWAEMPAGRIFSTQLSQALSEQWPRAVIRDRSHPSIVGWVVFNESWGIWHQGERAEQRHLADALYHLTKSLDPTRPVIGNDGWEFSTGDVWAVHSYEHGDGALARCIEGCSIRLKLRSHKLGGRGWARWPVPIRVPCPLVLSECGGVGFVDAQKREGQEPDFAYGDIPETAEQLSQICQRLLVEIGEIPQLNGFVWTQLTDVQQEVNGLLYFDRRAKIPLAEIADLVDSTHKARR
jgi:beta-galactosidase/beta-glucuronidase